MTGRHNNKLDRNMDLIYFGGVQLEYRERITDMQCDYLIENKKHNADVWTMRCKNKATHHVSDMQNGHIKYLENLCTVHYQITLKFGIDSSYIHGKLED